MKPKKQNKAAQSRESLSRLPADLRDLYKHLEKRPHFLLLAPKDWLVQPPQMHKKVSAQLKQHKAQKSKSKARQK